MPSNYDVIVAGLGAMGSAAAFHLARRGVRVLGLDRFAPPHSMGSSHGQTRIIREAYFEHPLYVPMVQRAYELWEQLAGEVQGPKSKVQSPTSGDSELLRQTGGLMIGRPDGAVFQGARQSAEMHRLPYEILTAAEVQQRFPALRPEDEMSAIWEPRAGILFPERCVAAHLSLAARHGAKLHYEEPVVRWQAQGDTTLVVTTRAEYHAARLILCAGSWITELAPHRKLPFTVERQVLFWFNPRNSRLFYPEHCPIHLWQFDGRKFFYGFPDLGQGVKVARHHEGELTTPGQVRREIAPEEVESMRSIVRRFLPEADGPLQSTTVCLYTNTPDEQFWIDWHPDCPQVLVVSPCSGHGFKFSSVIGQIVSELILGGKGSFDLSLFRNRAFQSANSPPAFAQ